MKDIFGRKLYSLTEYYRINYLAFFSLPDFIHVKMLAGISDDVPEEEISAVMFAQHYADSREYPSKESWDRIVEIYSLPKAKGIIASIRIIMFGNASGIPWSSFFNRFKGKPDNRSNILYEISIIICTILFIPIALVHSLLAKLFKRPLIKFKNS